MISNQSLTCPKGTSLTFEIDMDTGSDLTGATAQWALCESWFDQAKVYLTKTGTGDGLFIGQDAGVWKITVNLAPTDTLDVPSGLLYHDCKVLLQSGDVEDVANGPFSLDPSVNILDTNAPITRNLHALQALGRPSQVVTLTVGALARNLLATQSLGVLGQAATATVSSGLSAQTTQFLDRLLTLPSTTRQDQYAALIDGLVADGVWSSLDALCVAGADAATTLTNLVQDSYGASYAGAPTFTADRGINPSGTVSYLHTGINPSTITGNFTQNAAFMAVWNLGTAASNTALIRSAANLNCEIWPQYSPPGVSLWMVNNSGGTENSASNPSDPSGFYLATRTASNATALYRNGTSLGTSATASTAPENNELLVGFSSPSSWQMASWALGGALDATHATALYNRLQTYLHAIGAV
jgi:hypothetical protein